MCDPPVLPTASTAEDFKVLKGSRQTQRDLPQRRGQYQDGRMGKGLKGSQRPQRWRRSFL